MNVQKTISAIMQVRKNREHAGHIWLQGFYDIIDCADLDYEKADRYVGKKWSENPPFTKYHSSAQMFKLMKAIISGSAEPIPIHKIDSSDLLNNPDSVIRKIRKKAGTVDLFYVHLPIDEEHHLEFPMFKQENKCRFVYTLCEDCDFSDEDHGLPELSLRRSVLFGSRAPLMYDNRISINHQSPALIEESYKTLEDFVKECRIRRA